jgi:hypothetical protein
MASAWKMMTADAISRIGVNGPCVVSFTTDSRERLRPVLVLADSFRRPSA